MTGVDHHVAAVAAGVSVMALRISVLFWGHDLAFLEIEVTTGRRKEVSTRGKSRSLASLGMTRRDRVEGEGEGEAPPPSPVFETI
jgi:hypothetical protein